MQKTLFILICIMIPAKMSAIVIEPHNFVSARAGINGLYLQSPSLTRNDRLAYECSFNYPITVRYHAIVSLFIAPDRVKHSQNVSVNEDYYILTTQASFNLYKLFRYVASAGPAFIISQTRYDYFDHTETQQNNDYGIFSKLAIEYAFNTFVELGAQLALLNRINADKTDWLYGLYLTYNFNYDH